MDMYRTLFMYIQTIQIIITLDYYFRLVIVPSSDGYVQNQ